MLHINNVMNLKDDFKINTPLSCKVCQPQRASTAYNQIGGTIASADVLVDLLKVAGKGSKETDELTSAVATLAKVSGENKEIANLLQTLTSATAKSDEIAATLTSIGKASGNNEEVLKALSTLKKYSSETVGDIPNIKVGTKEYDDLLATQTKEINDLKVKQAEEMGKLQLTSGSKTSKQLLDEGADLSLKHLDEIGQLEKQQKEVLGKILKSNAEQAVKKSMPLMTKFKIALGITGVGGLGGLIGYLVSDDPKSTPKGVEKPKISAEWASNLICKDIEKGYSCRIECDKSGVDCEMVIKNDSNGVEVSRTKFKGTSGTGTLEYDAKTNKYVKTPEPPKEYLDIVETVKEQEKKEEELPKKDNTKMYVIIGGAVVMVMFIMMGVLLMMMK